MSEESFYLILHFTTMKFVTLELFFSYAKLIKREVVISFIRNHPTS